MVFRCRNSVFILIFAWRLIAQNAIPAASKPPHRFEYPAEHFSIELPAQWTEIDQALAGRLGLINSVLVPNAPKLKYDHVFTSSDLASHAVMIVRSGVRYTDAYFKDLEQAGREGNEAVKIFSSGSALQAVEAEYTSYDTGRHLLWATSKVSSLLGGEMRTLSGMYLTRTGTLGVVCHAKADDFEKSREECKQIIGSVRIDPEYRPVPPAPLSDLLRMTTDQANTTYQQLVDRIKAGDFSIDFRLLRVACARSSICEARTKPAELAEMSKATNSVRQSDLVDLCERLISRGFINIDAHAACTQAYTALNRPEKAKFHMDMVTALLQSILTVANGKTEETAYEVISLREIWAVMAGKHLPYFGEGVLGTPEYSRGNHLYHTWEVIDPRTKHKVVIFFNLDAMPDAK